MRTRVPATYSKFQLAGDRGKKMNKIMNNLFQEGPPENMITEARSRLRKVLIEAKENAIHYGRLEHPITTELFLAMRKNKVIRVNFGVSEHAFITQIIEQFDAPVYFDPDQTLASVEQIRSYLDGMHTDFEIPIDLSILTDFQQHVLQATQKIPRGQIATYLEIARKIGNPKAVRAVGQALGRNPIPIVIPCHRVIASNGSLGGYSGRGGLETKAKLLQLEGALLGV
jgi:methylated-DNA-[protein]-cysteine S-methyltransferase